jgi:hypothetical protein
MIPCFYRGKPARLIAVIPPYMVQGTEQGPPRACILRNGASVAITVNLSDVTFTPERAIAVPRKAAT